MILPSFYSITLISLSLSHTHTHTKYISLSLSLYFFLARGKFFYWLITVMFQLLRFRSLHFQKIKITLCKVTECHTFKEVSVSFGNYLNQLLCRWRIYKKCFHFEVFLWRRSKSLWATNGQSNFGIEKLASDRTVGTV